MQGRAVEQCVGFGDEGVEAGGRAEIGGDMMSPVRIALAFRRHRLARGGYDLPTRRAEMPYRRVADAPARAGENEILVLDCHTGKTTPRRPPRPSVKRLGRLM